MSRELVYRDMGLGRYQRLSITNRFAEDYVQRITKIAPSNETAGWFLIRMTTVAMPVYRSRIAPVFDFSDSVLLINLENNREVERSVMQLKAVPPSERVGALTRVGVRTLVCAGISDLLKTMLEASGIRVIWGVAGEFENVLTAFMRNSLDEPQFSMPGLEYKDVYCRKMPKPVLKETGNESRKRREWPSCLNAKSTKKQV
jgi:predicted Fe-Mo cluster-binding NifX family protein